MSFLKSWNNSESTIAINTSINIKDGWGNIVRSGPYASQNLYKDNDVVAAKSFTGTKLTRLRYTPKQGATKTILYYTSGCIRDITTTTKEFIREGSHKEYDDSGVLRVASMFKRGKLHGPCKLYHSDGRILETSSLYKGELVGYLKRYDNAGNLTLKVEYRQGKVRGWGYIWRDGEDVRSSQICRRGHVEHVSAGNRLMAIRAANAAQTHLYIKHIASYGDIYRNISNFTFRPKPKTTSLPALRWEPTKTL